MILPAIFMVACGKSGSSNNTPAHTHTYGEWSTDETDHWHTCSGCNETEKSAHTFVVKNNAENFWQECSACGKQQNKVSATTQIANAVQFKDAEGKYYTNAVAECEGSRNSIDNVAKTVKFTNDAFYKYDSTLGNPTPKELIYSQEADDTKVIYKKMDENSGWIKTTQSFSAFQVYAKNEIFTMMGNANELNFTYDEESNTYSATKDKDAYDYIYTLKFENGKLVNVYVKRMTAENVTNLDYTWTISYDTATIEIPSDLSVVGDTQWKEALSFNVTNFTQTIAMSDRTYTTKVTDNCIAERRIMPVGANSTENIYDIKNKKQYSKIIKTGEKYTVTDDSSLTFDSVLYNVGNPANRYLSIKNFFANFTYNTDKKVYYIASATIDSQVYQDVELTFDNGKLVKVEYQRTNAAGNTYTTTTTYTYGDTTVTVPKDSDCVFSVAYDKTNGNFVLSNASLKASETKTFVINISQDVFEANSESDKCEISGEFTTSGTISSISVKDANGKTIDNIASENNEFDCEITAAGKYYIEITASADCTGAWDIGFVDITPTPAAGSTKETAIAVPFSSTDSKFILNNIALSTTEKWFVLEITEATHSSYKKTSGKYELEGTTTLNSESDATLTIVAKNESGTEIAKNLNLTSLDAGKYYIIITVDKDCTGSLSFEFKTGKFDL